MATRYRDLQRPTLLQTGIVDNSAAQKAEALAGAFRSFSRTGAEVLGGLNAVQGAQVGAAEGAAGTPQPKTGWRALTRFGESYNSAAEVTYSNKLQTDIHERLSQLETESEADPVKFQALTEAYSGELMKTVPPEYAPRIGQMMSARISAGNIRVGEQAIQLERRTGLASYLDSTQTRIAATLEAIKGLSPEDGDAAIAETIAENERQLDAFKWMDPVDRVKLRDSFNKDFEAAVTGQKIGGVVDEIGQIARTDTVEADRMLATIEDRTDLSPDEKTEIRSKVRQQRELLESERSNLYYKDVAGLAQRLARDEYGVGVEREAERLYRLGALSDGEYKGYMAQSANNADRVIKENARARAAEGVMYLGGKLDPANPEHRKGVSTAFENEVARLGIMPGDDRYTQMALDITKQSNILPEGAESWARTSLLSGDPGLASRAAGFLTQLKKANPGAYEWQKEPKLASMAGLLMDNLGDGLSHERAYEMAYKDVYEVAPAEKEIRDADYNQYVKENDPSAELEKAFTQEVNWGFDKKPPPIPAAVRAEYDRLSRQFYNESGSWKQAGELATAQIKARWGVTEVNGTPEFTRYPLEQTYGFPASFIRADVAEQVKGLTDRPVRLTQSPTTNATRGLDWTVQYQREDGMWEILRDSKNRPAIYSPPMSSKQFDDAKTRIEAVDKAQVEKEREDARQRDQLRLDVLWQSQFPGTPVLQ